MHNNIVNKYYFINKLDAININKQDKQTIIIYRNYSSKILDKNIILKIKKICKKKAIKFYLSNNIKLALKLNLDGAYIPSFNKDFIFNSFKIKKNFELLGSAHTLNEIRIKEKQNINYIFLSPLFKNNKGKRSLGIYRFINLKNLTRKNVVALGGIKTTNFNIIKTINISNIASISLFQK